MDRRATAGNLEVVGGGKRTDPERAINNQLSQAHSSGELGDIPELEKAVKLARRNVSSARKQGVLLDIKRIDDQLHAAQVRGYAVAVQKELERMERRNAKGETVDFDATMTQLYAYAAKAAELGHVITFDTVALEAMRVRAEKVAGINRQRDAIIAQHLAKVGKAFVGLYEAATGIRSGE